MWREGQGAGGRTSDGDIEPGASIQRGEGGGADARDVDSPDGEGPRAGGGGGGGGGGETSAAGVWGILTGGGDRSGRREGERERERERETWSNRRPGFEAGGGLGGAGDGGGGSGRRNEGGSWDELRLMATLRRGVGTLSQRPLVLRTSVSVGVLLVVCFCVCSHVDVLAETVCM